MARPDWIEPHTFREWMSQTKLSKFMRVGPCAAGSYVQRCEREGKPLRHTTHLGSRRYRLLDVCARGRAEGLEILPPMVKERLRTVKQLNREIAELEKHRDVARHQLSLNDASAYLTGRTLLREDEIVAGSRSMARRSGVYFLIHGDRVVYVGQSIDVAARIAAHHTDRQKVFDRYAVIRCSRDGLDILESLYIHCLRPPLNGRAAGDRPSVVAPLGLENLITKCLTP